MNGFDNEFIDIVDFIYRITHRIWVERALGLIHRYYAAACVVQTPYGVTRSVEAVVAGTGAMISAFPDRESHFLNVAWCGDDQDGFYTSHLGFSRMSNRGPTIYGGATNRTVIIRTCADCISLNNQIHTEWLVRDNGALVRQLGFNLHDVARRLAAAADSQVIPPVAAVIPKEQLAAIAYKPTGGSAGDLITQMLQEIWNGRRLDRLANFYAADAIVHSSGGRVAMGLRNIGALIIAILASLPDARLRVEHSCWSDERDGLILAVRWTMSGTTRSGGFLGEVPANKPVNMMGMSHYRTIDGTIVEEWSLFDELAVLVQAYQSENAAAAS
jgi:predicted ester cyclase